MNPSNQVVGPVDVALDLRLLNVKLESRDDFFQVWKDLAGRLVGRAICSGAMLQITGLHGEWSMLVLDSRGVTVLENATRLNIIDLGRPPEIRHACKEHLKKNEEVFGPFFCPVCREEKSSDRLCESHAHFLENKFTTYCRSHLPSCQCREGCPDSSTFECDRCHKPFAERWKKNHPNDPLTLLCTTCYAFQFQTCAQCDQEGRRRLGKSQCAFPTGMDDERHGKRLCTLRHARQWQIWGPHWRGVILCEEHYKYLGQATPADLIWMLVTSRAPASFLRVKMKDIYRLRNIVNYVRRSELSWREMEHTMQMLGRRAAVPGIGRGVKDTVDYLIKTIGNVQNDLPMVEAQLLMRVREFYRSYLRSDPATAILSVTVKRAFGREGGPQTYRIAIRAGRDAYGRSMKGLLIGKAGALVNQLKETLKLQGVDFEE
jgi:hypothetical protein